MKRIFFGLALLTLLLFNGLTSCRKDRFTTDPSAKLTFSNDTIIFDTVFTTVGSATRVLKVYNPNNNKINISRIWLAGAAGNVYRMNVDGIPGRSFTDVEIPGKDSIFIFIEVTLDPNSLTTPLLVTDSILFETNGNLQDIDLVAWGQDAYFHTPAAGAGSPFFSVPCNDVWLNDKPHVIYGWLVVDSGCNLTIQEGAQIHVHPNSGLLIYNSGTLTAEGTIAQPIVFQGDRLEPDYDTVPGQWSGIIFLEAGPSRIFNADIKNGNVGIRAETISGAISLLEVEQVRVRNMSAFGIWLYKAADIRMINVLADNCGQYGFIATGGGNVFINHCSFPGYWQYDDRKTPYFGIGNYFQDASGAYVLADLNVEVYNSIIYGTEDDELAWDMLSGAQGDYLFRNCFIRSQLDLSDPTRFISVQKNVYPGFVSNSIPFDFHLDASSPAIDAGDPLFRVDFDLDGLTRGSIPDAGCYEFQ